MNKAYRVIWSAVQNAWVVVSELVVSHGKGSKSRRAARGISRLGVASSLLLGLLSIDVLEDKAWAADTGTTITNVAPAENSIAIGTDTSTKGAYTYSAGSIGAGNTAINGQTTSGIAIGNGATSYSVSGDVASDGIAVGDHASAVESSTAVGTFAAANQMGSSAIGTAALANGRDSTALGYATTTNRYADIAIGVAAVAGAPGSGDILGDPEGYNIAVGGYALATGGSSTALGVGAVSNNAGAVALGAGSVTDAAVGTAGINIAGTNYSFAGTTPTSTVSVGSVGSERTLTNVAAGRLSATSTDAVNGSQLAATNQAVEVLNEGAVKYDVNPDGTVNHDHVTLAGDNGTTIGNVAAGVNDTDAVNVSQLNAKLDAAKTHYFSVNDNGMQGGNFNNDGATGTNALAAGVGASATNWNALAMGSNATATQINGTALGFGALADEQAALAIGGHASAMSVNSVAIGSGATSKGQYSVAIGLGANTSANGAVALGMGSRTVSEDAIAMGSGAVASHTGSVALGAGSIADGSTLGNQAYAVGGTAQGEVNIGNRRLTGLAAGAEDSDAVNVAQLKAMTADAASGAVADAVMYDSANHDRITLGGTTYDSTSRTGGTTITNLARGEADSDAVNMAQLNETNAQVNLIDGRVTTLEGNVNNIVNGGGMKYFHSNSTKADSVAAGTDSVAVGPNAQASGAGAVALGDDAVASANGSIALGQGASDNGRGAETYTGQYSGAANATAGTVSVGNAATGETRTLSNVADARQATDAVNLRQLDGAVAQSKAYTDNTVKTINAATANIDNRVTQVAGDVTNLKNGTEGAFQINNTSNLPKPKATGSDSVAGGAGAEASAANSTAVGSNAKAKGKNSVAIGANSVAERDNSVAVGSAGAERQITHVAAGTRTTDAANVGQLNQAMADANSYTDQRYAGLKHDMNQMNDELSAGIAGAIAMAHLPQPITNGGNTTALGVGNFNGQSAVAVGVSRTSDDGKWTTKLGAGTNTQGTFSVGAGVGYNW
ncbi:YadA-like family protein [Pseudomonas sp. LA21]|uniref:ESPR-type extended signal peptide-containing protein n=1 Tax=unclassified Pseudomonas TaxID=196821 RepID=UPI001FB7DA45|nr:YadA-like family protein [Pseudomonas sp. LA21]MCJ1888070.1 YadA-like family protein [Pseudomonas sp. LA21]